MHKIELYISICQQILIIYDNIINISYNIVVTLDIDRENCCRRKKLVLIYI